MINLDDSNTYQKNGSIHLTRRLLLASLVYMGESLCHEQAWSLLLIVR